MGLIISLLKTIIVCYSTILITCHTYHLNIFSSFAHHDYGLSHPVGHLSYFSPSRQEPPIKVGRTVALFKGMFTATTILTQTEAPNQVIPLRSKIIIIGLWLFCVGQIIWYFKMQMVITPAATTSIISSVSMVVIANFVHCSLHGGGS